ncbi:MAG: protein kinase [Muribaculum sp.]|nr:protein kinase [Muribaculum sp.]
MSNTSNSDREEYQSGFITSGDDMRVNVGGLMSEKYSNITLIHGSDSSHFVLYSAIRYGKRYILKGISQKYQSDPLYQALLAKEFEIGISLDHPNIRRTIGFEHIDEIGNVIVLEYVDGESLEDAIREKRLNPESGMSVLGQVADALEYLERRQVLHRDIKPANIMLTHSGMYAKLIDFSHADAESYVMLKDPAGTNRYIAPEIIADCVIPSVKTDIYSFGMVAGDVAETIGDSSLMEIAKRCCNVNPRLRPDSFSGILVPYVKNRFLSALKSVLASKILTLILSLTLIAIWIYIFNL